MKTQTQQTKSKAPKTQTNSRPQGWAMQWGNAVSGSNGQKRNQPVRHRR